MTSENTIATNLREGLRQPVRDVAQGFSPELRPKGLSYIFNWLLIIFFFLLPLQTRYIFREAPLYEYGTLSVFAVEVLGWVVIAFGSLRMRNEKLKIKNAKWLWWLGGLVVVAFVSIAWAPDKAIALQAAVRLLEGVLLYFVISTCTTPNPSSTRRGNESISSPARGEVRRGGSEWIMYAFLAGATIQAVLGIYQFLAQSTFASTWLGMALHDPAVAGTAVVGLGTERWLRAYGGLPHANILGGYLVVALAVAVLLIGRDRASGDPEARSPDIVFAITLVLLTGIFFSFSRVAWIAALIIIVPFFAGRRWFLLGYLVLLVTLYQPLVSGRLNFKSAERLEVKSRVERVEGMREARELIKKHPVLGVGIGNYTQAVAQEIHPNKPLYTYQPVHNVPLLIFAELGIVGLALFAVILYLSLIRPHSRPSAVVLLCFFVLMTLDHYLWSLPFGILLFWSILGLSTSKEQVPLDRF